MLCRMLGEDIALHTSLEPELPRIRIDPGYLVQIVMNLAVNARDAMPRGGNLTIATRPAERDGKACVMLEIADQGCGMTEEVKSRAFEPFFTTKGIGSGTGLGLSVVHGIVEQAGGRIELLSEQGLGTTFRIYFPAVAAVPSTTLVDRKPRLGGCETILVVDDDRYVRAATSKLLRSLGYTVVESATAKEAVMILTSGTELALLVSDVVMPDMDGCELVAAARTHRPELRVLLTSGYTDDAVARHGIGQLDVPFLEKPFGVDALAQMVRRVLDASSCLATRSLDPIAAAS
jgi:two-component system, cell cycle sensor histidine kinase and response regulator CckA